MKTFRDLIASNKRRSAFLMVFFWIFYTVVVTVLAIGGMAYLAGNNMRIDEGSIAGVALIATIVSLLAVVLAYTAGDSFILSVAGAKPLEKPEDPELYNVVDEMCIAAGIPRPDIYLIEDPALNAFATGRDPDHATVAITRGLREKLTRDELQGVIAHEISHIRNFDIRLSLVLAVLVGCLVMLADFFRQMTWWGPGSSSRSRDDDDRDSKNSGLGIIFIVLGMVLAIIAPFIAQLIQLAVSRQREYLADASAVELTRYAEGLESALRKLETDPQELIAMNRGTAHLYIVNPVKKFQDRSATWFSSHPPLADRIQRLESLSHQPKPPNPQA